MAVNGRNVWLLLALLCFIATAVIFFVAFTSNTLAFIWLLLTIPLLCVGLICAFIGVFIVLRTPTKRVTFIHWPKVLWFIAAPCLAFGSFFFISTSQVAGFLWMFFGVPLMLVGVGCALLGVLLFIDRRNAQRASRAAAEQSSPDWRDPTW